MRCGLYSLSPARECPQTAAQVPPQPAVAAALGQAACSAAAGPDSQVQQLSHNACGAVAGKWQQGGIGGVVVVVVVGCC
jgi:hypothetical protein